MHSWLIVIVISLTTIAIRFLPFVLFKNRTPSFVMYLGTVLPMCAMAMLVVYCLKDVSLKSAESFVPSLVSGAIVILTYKWKHNTGISILSGTIIYMLLVQNFFR